MPRKSSRGPDPQLFEEGESLRYGSRASEDYMPYEPTDEDLIGPPRGDDNNEGINRPGKWPKKGSRK